MSAALWGLCVIIASVHLALGQCPFSQALKNGQRRERIIAETKDQLIDEQYLLSPGQPASLIWNNEPLTKDLVDVYNRSNAMVIAKQFYIQQYLVKNPSIDLTINNRAELLRKVTKTIPKNYRCTENPKCASNYRYVMSSGQCNNLKRPKWGAAGSPYSRLLKPVFDDGIYMVRKSVFKVTLPSPRSIGNVINQHSVFPRTPQPLLNYASLMFGQLLTHDSGLRHVYQNHAGGSGLSCCPRDGKGMLPDQLRYYGCDPIEIPHDDPFYQKFGMTCMSYMRTQPTLSNDCSIESTEFSNSVSHFIDLSVIYGSDESTTQSLRSKIGGRLLIENGVAAIEPGCTGDFCYITGDSRAMPNPTLGLCHSVLIRYHNWIADRLAVIKPKWGDERLFQEVRRIVTAVYQNVVFNEWLPLYVGRDVAERRNVTCTNLDGYCGRYDKSMDPSTLNEFAVGAFRLYHKYIPMRTNFYGQDFELTKSLKLSDSIIGSAILEIEFQTMLRGLLKDPVWVGKYPDNIRNEVFNNDNANGIGLDLLAVDIARGRDHGLSPYHVYLEKSTNGRRTVSKWDDLSDVMSEKSIAAMQKVYSSVFDIDLLVGLLLEEKDDIYTGPVGQYIVEEQFYRYKYGDRFFYSLENNDNRFTKDQIKEINGQNFANILCAVSGVDQVFARSFEVESPNNPRFGCGSLFPINLQLWKKE